MGRDDSPGINRSPPACLDSAQGAGTHSFLPEAAPLEPQGYLRSWSLPDTRL